MAFLDATLTSRYELKYLISKSRADAIRDYVRPFTRLDAHAAKATQHRYTINSLYLDTPELMCFVANQEGYKNRFKMRIRTYNDNPKTPAFFEIKKRTDRLIRKSRARVTRDAAPDLLAGRPFYTSQLAGAEHDDFQEFLLLRHRAAVDPILWVRYFREAHESVEGDPARITFDTEVEHAVPVEYTVSTRRVDWRSTGIDGVILEIKFTDFCPYWVQDLIRTFELDKRSMSKYCHSVRQALETGLPLPVAIL